MIQELFVPTLLLLGICNGGKWENLKPSVSPKIQEASVLDMLHQLIPSHTHLFTISVEEDLSHGRDVAILTSFKRNGSVRLNVRANSGVSAAWGIGEYIKKEIGGHFSWDTVRIEFPDVLPLLPQITFETHEKFKYWDNVCTFGYSYPFWDWVDWEKHINWMALNGINLALAFTGQEVIWYRVYSKMGLSDRSVFSFFSGPAFLPWNRMGNMNGFGGPLSLNFLEKKRVLQHQILTKLRNLGIITVLPGFAGYVPDDMPSLYPKSSFSKMGPWCSFPQTTLLNLNDSLFQEISSLFLKEYIQEYGTDHAYNIDVFNEMTPQTTNPDYFFNSSKSIYKGMVGEDPDAVWIMQGWLFLNSFWKDPQIRALLTANPIGTMIILDLDSTNREQYTKTKGYYGQPFIFNNLNNFGGAIGLYGRTSIINERIFKVRIKYDNLVGIGFTPEGLTDTFAPTELMSEMSWRKKPMNHNEIKTWYSMYAERRYGMDHSCSKEAWTILSTSVFNATGDNFHRLTLLMTSPHPTKRNVAWYSVHDLVKAWDSMINCINVDPKYMESSGFKFDIIDLTRQVIADVSPYWFYESNRCFLVHDMNGLVSNMTPFFDILNDLDLLLNTDERFMFGKWIKDARRTGTSMNESNLFEFNARNQVTIWGPRGEISDYAAKQWGGLIKGFYIPRFVMYFNQLVMDLAHGKKFNKAKFNRNFLEKFGIPFSSSRQKFPINPVSNTIDTVLNIYSKWRNVFTESFLNSVDKNAKKI